MINFLFCWFKKNFCWSFCLYFAELFFIFCWSFLFCWVIFKKIFCWSFFILLIKFWGLIKVFCCSNIFFADQFLILLIKFYFADLFIFILLINLFCLMKRFCWSKLLFCWSKLWLLFFFYVSWPFKTWVVMPRHNSLSFVALNNCALLVISPNISPPSIYSS